MSTVVANQTPFLRTSRNFPLEMQPLAVELSRSYVDIAEKMNDRIIGIYPTNTPAITGESWFLTSHKQQTLRKIFTFTAAGNIPHGLIWTSIAQISPNSYGSFTDGTNWYGAIFGSSTAIAGQVSFYVTPTNVVVLSGAGVPAISSGIINLEWLSQA
jgi:hypothetical protein